MKAIHFQRTVWEGELDTAASGLLKQEDANKQ